MRAVVIAEQGASRTLTELPTPEPGAGEVLVRVEASSLNGFDTAVAAGYLAGMMEHRFPVVLGKDFAGTVEAVGAGVTRFAAGDRVFGVVTKAFLGDGGFGEYVVVGQDLGTAAIPVRSLGATDVVDHTADLAAQVRELAPTGVDVVLHLAGDGTALAGLLAENGRLASTLGFGPDQHPNATAIMATPAAATLDRLAADAAAGRINIPVHRTYPLSEVPAAFGDFAGGTLGKLAITLA